MTRLNVTVDLTTEDKHGLAVAEAFVATGYGVYIAKGGARRNPEDRYDESIGINLAVARSLKSLARQIEKEAWMDVKAAAERQDREAKARADRIAKANKNRAEYEAQFKAEHSRLRRTKKK